MDKLTLKQFRYFETVARTGHFGRAAELCAVSQPALSMQIKELEHTLGAPLLERMKNGARLTGFGEVILPKIRSCLDATAAVSDLAETHLRNGAMRIRLGIIPTVAPYLLPRLMAEVSQVFPALELMIRETLTSRLLEELSEGQIDAAILALPSSAPGVEEVTLTKEPFLLVRPMKDADQSVPSPEGLQAMRLLLLEEGHCFRDQALAFCQLGPGATRGLLEASSLTTLVQLVEAGLGVTLLPQMAVAVETRGADVNVVSFPKAPPARRLGMVWRRDAGGQESYRHIATLLRSLMA